MIELSLNVKVVVEPDGDRFHAYTPDFRGLHVDGDTVDDALENASEAVLVYLNSITAHGDPLPIGVITKMKAPKRRRVSSQAIVREAVFPCHIPQMSGIS